MVKLECTIGSPKPNSPSELYKFSSAGLSPVTSSAGRTHPFLPVSSQFILKYFSIIINSAPFTLKNK